MKSRFEVFFNHMTVRYCSVIVVATPLWGTQGFFFLGCRRKRHKLVLFSRLCTNKLHDDQLSKRQIVQTKHANLNLFVSQHMRGIPGNNSRHGEETIRARVASPVRRLFHCFLSSPCCILQHGDNFLWFLFLFSIFQEEWRNCFLSCSIRHELFQEGKIGLKIVLFIVQRKTCIA